MRSASSSARAWANPRYAGVSFMRTRQMTKRAQWKLAKLVREFVLVHGGIEIETNPLGGLGGRMALPTICGTLHVTPYGSWIACRFYDTDAAVAHFGYQPGYGRLNPHSGKWNFHFSAIPAADALAEFEAEVLPLLIPVPAGCATVPSTPEKPLNDQ
jgi:hypothetical protein